MYARIDPDETRGSLQRDNGAHMMNAVALKLAPPPDSSDPAPRGLAAAHGIVWGAGLGGLVWAFLLYAWLG